MEGRARGWFRGAWLCLAMLGALAAWVVPRCVVLCSASLKAVPEPADWRDWPTADGATTCRGVCPGGDVPRDGWEPRGGPTPPGLWLRQDPKSDVYVVAGAPRADEAPRERFVSAFRREGGGRLAFTSGRAAACLATLGLALAVLAFGLSAAKRRLRVAGELSESSRDAFLSLSSDPASYRRAPTTRARQAEDGAHDARSAEGARLAIGVLRNALLAVAGLVALFFVCAGGVVLREWVRLMF